MKAMLKKALFAVAPQWMTAQISARARAHSHRLFETWGCKALGEKLVQHLGNKVQEGPFAGMTLSPMTTAENLGPFLLGTYESELDSAWEAIFKGQYSQLIDVGAKFGFYAVGLAKRYPDAPVIAFDTDSWAREAVAEMAKVNEVRNVRVEGFCSAGWMMGNVAENAFIISDCEGYEDNLFTPEVISQLKSATLIIETHDTFVPNVTDRLRSRFASTHEVLVLGESEQPRRSRLPLDFLSDQEQELAHNEFRAKQYWLLCLTREGHNRGLAL